MGPILVPYGSHMDVPRWVPDESLLQNPHQSHMGCPYRTHIITLLGPIWVIYSLLAGMFDEILNRVDLEFKRLTPTSGKHLNKTRSWPERQERSRSVAEAW